MNTRSPDHSLNIDAHLLDRLIRETHAVTVHALARERHLSVTRIQNRLDQLRAAGCRFDQHPQHGLRLTQTGLGVWQDYLNHRTGYQRVIQVYRQTTSTQDRARRMLETDPAGADNALIVADHQTAGRGRLGRSWLAPPGTALTFSVIHQLAPADAASLDRLTFAATVAVARAIDRFTRPHRKQCEIKWPNDIYLGGKKLAGILVEACQTPAGTRAAIVGIGINVALQRQHLPDDPALQNRITSLAILGLAVDRLAVLDAILHELDAALAARDLAPLLAEWRSRCILINQQVHLRSAGRDVTGQVIDLDPHAGLILRTAAGQLVHLPAATTTVL